MHRLPVFSGFGFRRRPAPGLRRLRGASSLVVIALGALLALLPVVARAATPTIVAFPVTGEFPIGPCPNGVTLDETFTAALRVITFFDQAGTPVRVQIIVHSLGVVTNPVTGQSVKDPGYGIIIIDPATNASTHVGLNYSTTVPGVGVLFHDVGRVSFDAAGNVTFEAGPQDVLHIGGGDATGLFCQALT